MTTEMNEDQIFYTIFCQLQVAIYNLVIGKDLKNQNKASWAVVAYYYSMLHSARTIVMMGEEDVPTNHGKLIELLKESDVKNKSWRTAIPKEFGRKDIIQKISRKTGLSCETVDDRLKTIGNNMYYSQKIRNQNSYEIYIISHQTNHSEVTPILDEGIEILNTESQSAVIIALNMFKEYINQLEPTKKDAYLSFVMDENSSNDGFNYLYNVVFKNQKIPHDLIKESKTWIDPFNEIEYDVDDVVKERLKEFKNNIVQSSFSLKTDRMEGLSKLVDKLSSVNFYHVIPEEIR
ncbi:MAG: hypothetical protein OIN89_07855 [Candidatus Methanoperedens sp.]|jgi:uncharacterized protein (UPF0332 family)|nr:hypothetical protein [Candidatus Methanoperedens sp.]PKL53488.1 MAG: hypothetical protein CVV36_06895 [Candidatus Methanoperedenaceae archaeon HGW-Methanoperedenaceae-1]